MENSCFNDPCLNNKPCYPHAYVAPKPPQKTIEDYVWLVAASQTNKTSDEITELAKGLAKSVCQGIGHIWDWTSGNSWKENCYRCRRCLETETRRSLLATLLGK